MKLLAALLLALSFNANADVMTMQNEALGEIVLTANACPWSKDKELYYAYGYSSEETIKGCWLKESDIVVIGWVIDKKIMYKFYEAIDFKLKKTI